MRFMLMLSGNNHNACTIYLSSTFKRMALQVKLKFLPKLWDKTNKAVKHFIRARNKYDNKAPFDGFSSACISNVTAHATFAENDERFEQSLIDQHDSGAHCAMSHFACENSCNAFFSDCMEQVTVAATAVTAAAEAMQKYVNVIECDNNKFTIKNLSEKRSIEKQKGARKNVKLKDHQHVDVIAIFDQRTLSADSEVKLNEVVFNYHNHGIAFKNAMLFAVQFKIAQSNCIRGNALLKLCHENIIVDCKRGPHALFPKAEREAIFGRDLVESACMLLMPPFCTKKNKDECQLTGAHRHKQLENCARFLISMSVLFTMHNDVREEFDFIADKSSNPNSK